MLVSSLKAGLWARAKNYWTVHLLQLCAFDSSYSEFVGHMKEFIEPVYSLASVGVWNSSLLMDPFASRFYFNITCRALYWLVDAVLPMITNYPVLFPLLSLSKDRYESLVLDTYDVEHGARRVLDSEI